MTYTYVRKNPPANYITLIDGGYWARFTGKRNGKQVNLKQKVFRFTKYNHDPIAAKAAAEKWVKYWAPRLKKPKTTTERSKRHHTKARSSTGYVGVYREERIRGNCVYTAILARWCETIDGERKQRVKCFKFDPSVKGDEERAIKLAVKHRRSMEHLHYEGKI